MIRSEGQDPQQFTISRRTTNRRRHQLRVQQSTSLESPGKANNGYSSSDSNSNSSTSSIDDHYQYRNKKRRLLQAYAACSKPTQMENTNSDASSNSGLTNNSDISISFSNTKPPLSSSSSESSSASASSFSSATSSTTAGSSSSPSNNSSGLQNGASINSKHLPVSQRTPLCSNEIKSESGLNGTVCIKKEKSPLSSSSTAAGTTTVNMAVNIIKPEKSGYMTNGKTNGMKLNHANSHFSEGSSVSRTFPTIKSTPAHQFAMNYPFNLLVEAAVQMREFELRTQQMAPQWIWCRLNVAIVKMVDEKNEVQKHNSWPCSALQKFCCCYFCHYISRIIGYNEMRTYGVATINQVSKWPLFSIKEIVIINASP